MKSPANAPRAAGCLPDEGVHEVLRGARCLLGAPGAALAFAVAGAFPAVGATRAARSFPCGLPALRLGDLTLALLARVNDILSK